MQGDIELIRAILISLKKKVHSGPSQMLVHGYPREMINYHCRLLANEGLMTVAILSTGSVLPRALTEEGLEFANAIQDYKLWNKAQPFLAKFDDTWSLDLVKILIVKITNESIGL